MSTNGAPALRIITFGELTTGVWGAAWAAAEPSVAVGLLEPGAAAQATAVRWAPSEGTPNRIEGTTPGDDWVLAGGAVELTLSPAGEPAGAVDGFDQLCRARGWIVVGGRRHTVDSLGRRGVRPALDLRALESIRDVSGWSEPGEGLALSSLRPRGARGHDRDVVTASLLVPTGADAVIEPRLSTTYGAGGWPTRVSLELWLGEEEDGEQYARRLAGEALDASAELAGDDIDVHARLLRWHSRGREGAGVYLLARPRLGRSEARAIEPIR